MSVSDIRVVGGGACEDLLQQQTHQLMLAVVQPLAVCGINHPDERVGLFKVVLPVSAESLLSADIPW